MGTQIEDVNSCSSRTLHSLHRACPWWCHGLWILQIRHHHRWYGQHEATEDLLGVFADTWIGKADARAVQRHPSAPFQSHHQATHTEDHSYNIHVVWRQVILYLSLIIWTRWFITDFLFRSSRICRAIHLENLQYNALNKRFAIKKKANNIKLVHLSSALINFFSVSWELLCTNTKIFLQSDIHQNHVNFYLIIGEIIILVKLSLNILQFYLYMNVKV